MRVVVGSEGGGFGDGGGRLVGAGGSFARESAWGAACGGGAGLDGVATGELVGVLWGGGVVLCWRRVVVLNPVLHCAS